MRIELIVASLRGGAELPTVGSWLETARTKPYLITVPNPGYGAVRGFEEGRKKSKLLQYGGAEIQGYIHDDVWVYEEGWDERVLAEFEDPSVGVVGFGGGWGHGADDLYIRPYQLTQLGRMGYASNQRDAAVHGDRFDGSAEVAVLDGFVLFVRSEILEKVGGWPVEILVFHCYDYWLCCTAHRLGYQVRLVGVDCFHEGGQTSTGDQYSKWLKENLNCTDEDVHRESHLYIFEEFPDVLPWRVHPDRRAKIIKEAVSV